MVGALLLGQGIGEAILMHRPVRSRYPTRLAFVKDQSFLHTDNLVRSRRHNLLLASGGLPIAGDGGPVDSTPIKMLLPFSPCEEIPLPSTITFNKIENIISDLKVDGRRKLTKKESIFFFLGNYQEGPMDRTRTGRAQE